MVSAAMQASREAHRREEQRQHISDCESLFAIEVRSAQWPKRCHTRCERRSKFFSFVEIVQSRGLVPEGQDGQGFATPAVCLTRAGLTHPSGIHAIMHDDHFTGTMPRHLAYPYLGISDMPVLYAGGFEILIIVISCPLQSLDRVFGRRAFKCLCLWFKKFPVVQP